MLTEPESVNFKGLFLVDIRIQGGFMSNYFEAFQLFKTSSRYIAYMNSNRYQSTRPAAPSPQLAMCLNTTNTNHPPCSTSWRSKQIYSLAHVLCYPAKVLNRGSSPLLLWLTTWRFILRPFPRRFSFLVVLGVLGVLSGF